MFVKPRRLAVGAAVLAPVASLGAPAAHAATPPPPSTPTAKNYCALNAVTDAEYKAGVRSVSVCFATPQEAVTAINGGGAVSTSFAISSSILATYNSSRTGNGTQQFIYGSGCDAKLGNLDGSNMAAFSKGMCSSAKNFTGTDFTGNYAVSSGSLYPFDAPVLRNIHSISFAA